MIMTWVLSLPISNVYIRSFLCSFSINSFSSLKAFEWSLLSTQLGEGIFFFRYSLHSVTQTPLQRDQFKTGLVCFILGARLGWALR